MGYRAAARMLFSLAVLVSLLLAAAAAAMWIRSYTYRTRWETHGFVVHSAGMGTLEIRRVTSLMGQVCFEWLDQRYIYRKGSTAAWHARSFLPPGSLWTQNRIRPGIDYAWSHGTEEVHTRSRDFSSLSVLGFHYVLSEFRDGPHPPEWVHTDRGRLLIIPWYAVEIVLLMLPLAWVLRLRRVLLSRGRAKRGLCIHCGYDLRATPERCPECGTVRRGCEKRR